MSQLKNFAQGIQVIFCIFWIFSCVTLANVTNLFVGLAAFLILIIPFGLKSYYSINILRKPEDIKKKVIKVKNILIGFQGAGIASWLFDIATTYFAFTLPNIVERNILGWPLAIIVGAIAYVPSSIGVYYLLYKVDNKWSFIAAIFITLISSCNVFVNFFAALNNFAIFAYLTSPNLILLIVWWIIIIGTSVGNLFAIKKNKQISELFVTQKRA